MVKKFAVYISAFLLLGFVNVYTAKKINGKSQKTLLMQKIIDTIGTNYDPSTQFSRTTPLVLGEYTSEIITGDGRVANLKAFFRRYGSPLYDEAEHIVNISDKYHFDYRLLPAIAMQESNLCKYIPEDSHNCWGWGIYGTTVTKFDSYADAIETVSRGIKKNYIDKGLVTASKIMEKYTPSSNGSWAKGVNTFLKVLE